MGFGHERLDVYRAAIDYVGWAYRFCEGLPGLRNAKDQLLRASQAIPLNIAEGNGKATDGDRRRYFEIARGSALGCGAIQDVLQVCGALTSEENTNRKAMLDRIVAMLTKLGQRGYTIHEEAVRYRTGRDDTDSDCDPDADRKMKPRTSQPGAPPNSRPPSPASTPPEIETSDSFRTLSSGGCG
jgi:four helix bundle protein